MTTDKTFMREAIRLARKGLGQTRPNPAVGCVLVKNGRILARGWHRRAGLPHAEIEALRALKKISDARGATAYITLEPCSTHGRTPPCTRALIDAGIQRIVLGATDPNPKHRGRSLAIFRRAGLEVIAGVLADECAALNPEFHHVMTTGLPWVIAKCGMSLDGRLTRPPGEGPRITSAAARADAMKLRVRVDAILVGAGTVRADDPSLTIRGLQKITQPWRVVWAPRRRPPAQAKIFADRHRARTLVLPHRTLRAALRELARRGIQSVLVEGGGYTLGQLFDARLANEVTFYIAPLLAGGATPSLSGRGSSPLRNAVTITKPHYTLLGTNVRIQGLVAYKGA